MTAAAPQPIKIMPLGASNTYGMYQDATSPGGYRGPLQYMLQAQGVSYDFVGLDKDGAIGDADHNGHSGKPIDWFINPVNEGFWDQTGVFSHWIDSGGKPAVHYFIEQADLQSTDVILLLAGTNDVRLGDSAEKMLSEMDQLLSLIINHPANPQVHVMTLQPIGGDWWEDNDPTRTNNDTIRIFNEGLETLVSKYADLGVTLVSDDATRGDLSTDGVHLTEAGYRDMASAWYYSLMATDTLIFNEHRPELTVSSARDGAAWAAEVTGSKRADKLFGGADRHDKLDGREGADTMTGRTGDDTYVVDNRRDVVVEQAGEGVDTILTSLNNFSLAHNVENLTFTGTDSSSLAGNDLANVLRGGAGADTLDGGAGADVYWGGAGADTFVLRRNEAAGDCLNMEVGDQLRLVGFGRGAVMVEVGAPATGTTASASGNWCISYNGGVEVIQITGQTNLTEGTDYIFV